MLSSLPLLLLYVRCGVRLRLRLWLVHMLCRWLVWVSGWLAIVVVVVCAAGKWASVIKSELDPNRLPCSFLYSSCLFARTCLLSPWPFNIVASACTCLLFADWCLMALTMLRMCLALYSGVAFASASVCATVDGIDPVLLTIAMVSLSPVYVLRSNVLGVW